MYFVRFFMEGGLSVAAFGLLPAALSLTDLSQPTIWRLSSAGAAILFSTYLPFLLRRRRHVTRGPLPIRTMIAFATSIAAVIALWVNVLGTHLRSSAAAYCLALTWLLIVGGWVFVDNLALFFGFGNVPAGSPESESGVGEHAPEGSEALAPGSQQS